MLKVGCDNVEFVRLIVVILQAVWKESKDWIHAIIVSIPNKDVLKNSDNCKDVSLLETAGKLTGIFIQDRLQSVAEQELPECQCGLRRGRGCTDIIYLL